MTRERGSQGGVVETFRFGEVTGIEHTRLVDPEAFGECPECWSNYPKRCKCGGWVHAQFVSGDIEERKGVLEFGCDRCGKEYETIDRSEGEASQAL